MDARMMELDKVMDEPVALRLTQLNPAPPPTPPPPTSQNTPGASRFPSGNLSLIFSHLCGKFFSFLTRRLVRLEVRLSLSPLNKNGTFRRGLGRVFLARGRKLR